MKIPEHIIKKVKKYEKARDEYYKLHNQLETWFEEKCDDGVRWNDFEITDTPKGHHQSDGEYCSQQESGYSPDCGSGTMYYKISENEYVAAEYDF